MGKNRRQVSKIEGRKRATDQEILDAYKKGMFLNQIMGKYKIGKKRLRRITREYDEKERDVDEREKTFLEKLDQDADILKEYIIKSKLKEYGIEVNQHEKT